MTWIARVTSMASLSAGFAQALTGIWRRSRQRSGSGALVIVLGLAGLTWINVRGVKQGVRTAVVLASGRCCRCWSSSAVGVLGPGLGSLSSVPAPAAKGLGEAALLLLFAYAGFENTAAPAGEFKNPKRDVPFALMVMIATVTTIYTLVQLVAVGVVPGPAQLGDAAGRRRRDPPGPLRRVAADDRRRALDPGNEQQHRARRARATSTRWPSRAACPAGLARIHPRLSDALGRAPGADRDRPPARAHRNLRRPGSLSVVARMATYVGTAAAVPVLRRKMPAASARCAFPAAR